MFLVNEILDFAPGRREEGLERLAWIHSLMAPQPGFHSAVVAKYLGDGTRHTVLRLWLDEASYQAFRQGPDGNYGRGRPMGLYTNDPVVPQWNSIAEAGGHGPDGFLVKLQWQVPEDGWNAFIQRVNLSQAAAAQSGSLAEMRAFRAKDRSEALVIARFADRVAFERVVESPSLAASREGSPEGLIRLSTHCYEVVNEVSPAN